MGSIFSYCHQYKLLHWKRGGQGWNLPLQRKPVILQSSNFCFKLLTGAFICLQEEAESTFREQIQQKHTGWPTEVWSEILLLHNIVPWHWAKAWNTLPHLKSKAHKSNKLFMNFLKLLNKFLKKQQTHTLADFLCDSVYRYTRMSVCLYTQRHIDISAYAFCSTRDELKIVFARIPSSKAFLQNNHRQINSYCREFGAF